LFGDVQIGCRVETKYMQWKTGICSRLTVDVVKRGQGSASNTTGRYNKSGNRVARNLSTIEQDSTYQRNRSREEIETTTLKILTEGLVRRGQ
jgi:hypothetical protein